jgi:hypothetical protein
MQVALSALVSEMRERALMAKNDKVWALIAEYITSPAREEGG